MEEVIPRGYAPLDATDLYTLIHGAPPPHSLPAAAHAMSGHSNVDVLEPVSPAIAPPRLPPPDVSVDLENLQAWRALAEKARALDAVTDRQEAQRSITHAAGISDSELREERDELRKELRYQLNRPRRHFSGRNLKIRRRLKALRMNLRASGWPVNYLPLRRGQYASGDTEKWLEQLRAWDRAILSTPLED